MLTYLQVHLFYTLPPTIFLWLIYRPFMTAFDKFKITVLCVIAVIYTTPWDNYIVFHKAWWYRNDAIIGTIGYVPIEEYFFFVIQTFCTAVFTSLMTRWLQHAKYLRPPSPFKRLCVCYIIITATAPLVFLSWKHAIPATKTFYIGALLWWSLPVLMYLWYVCGVFVVNRIFTFLMCICVPSIYFCWVDLIALRADVWHINEETSLEIFFIADLPVEEILFFFISNTIVVTASFGFDRANVIIDTHFKESINMNETSCFRRFTRNLRLNFSATILDESDLDKSLLNDLMVSLETAKHGSSPFPTMEGLLPQGKF